jgi:hypothetical protein
MPANPTPAGIPVRLFYVDDSGAPDTGWILYSWIECAIGDWRIGLRSWIDLRRQMFADYRIPPAYELHTTKFLGGRGNPSTDPAWNVSKEARLVVLRKALDAIADPAGILRVGTVCRDTPARGKAYARERVDVYSRLVEHLDTRMAAAGELGLIFMDGNGTENGYYAVHRRLKLAHRHVIEDPLFQPAHRSQWVQMADIAAYTAYQSLLRHPAKRFAWDWYQAHLSRIDVNGGPIQI